MEELYKKLGVLFIALVAAIIPFGTFYINKKYLRNENT